MNISNFVFAQEGVIENPVVAPLYGTGGTQAGTKIIGSLLRNIFIAMIIVGMIILIIMIIWSGIAIITAGQDKDKLQNAQRRLTWAIVGFIILISVFAIAAFISNFLGLEFFRDLKIPFPTP